MVYLRACRGLLLPAAALILGGSAVASPGTDGNTAPRATVAVSEQSPFLGKWELDLTRMPDTYGPPPRRVTFTFTDIGAGQWRTEVEITGQDGSARRGVIAYRRDGRAVSPEGNIGEGDSAALKSPAPNVLVLCIGQDKRLGSVRVYSISPDGTEMTESAANVDGEGTPFVRTFYFRRIE